MIEELVIERKKLFEHVAAHIEGQILAGNLKPGDQLPPERDLQARFGVGRPAIREALIALQRSGLVEIANGSRARVCAPSASSLFLGIAPAVRQMISSDSGQRHFQEARMLFEVALVREAASRAGEADLAALKSALNANRNAMGDVEAFIDTDIAFHFEFARIAGNPIFIALHDQISDWLRGQRVITLARKGQDKIAYKAHEAIYRAVCARSPDRAEAEMRAHLQQLTAAFWRQNSKNVS